MVAKKLLRNIRKVASGLSNALLLNCEILLNHVGRRKVIIFQMHTADQLIHVESVLCAINEHPIAKTYAVIVLVHPVELARAKIALNKMGSVGKVSSYYTSMFLVFWNLVITLDQRMRLPFINFLSGLRICMFHGQPTKGNVYAGFNYAQIDGLFVYGPMMRQYYETIKRHHSSWPDCKIWNIGQPKTDVLFASKKRSVDAYKELGLDSTIPTVVYAPSFESCCSLATHGEAIINAMLSQRINLIIKPHPAFYRVVDDQDEFFQGSPHAEEWRGRAEKLNRTGRVFFNVDQQLGVKTALDAATILVTDHSGIAFDAILRDIPVVFFDCPEFFDDYLPRRYGLVGKECREELAINAGRSAGVVVGDVRKLRLAIQLYLDKPALHNAERSEVRRALLYNPGSATEAFLRQLVKIVE